MDEATLPALFDDGKAPDAFRTIGEVAKALGIRQHVLRYWEEQVPQLSPVKRSGGRRYYRPEDVSIVRQIDRLVHRDGYTLRGARLAIESVGDRRTSVLPDAAPVQSGTDRLPSSLRADLRAIRTDLARALEI